jgi:hypothetical protein
MGEGVEKRGDWHDWHDWLELVWKQSNPSNDSRHRAALKKKSKALMSGRWEPACSI